MWNQWIFDDDLVDNRWSQVRSFSDTWRFGSTSGNNGEPVPELVISTIGS